MTVTINQFLQNYYSHQHPCTCVLQADSSNVQVGEIKEEDPSLPFPPGATMTE